MTIPHDSHEIDWYNVSHYKFVCSKCGATNCMVGWDKLALPCSAPEPATTPLLDAVENVVIAYHMGWDMEGVLEVLTNAYEKRNG
jgi:hypothetical protein